MKKHKMTENNLEQLEKNIQAHQQDEGRLPSIQPDNQSIRSVRSNVSQKSKASVQSRVVRQADQESCISGTSYQSSRMQKSLYELGDEDDEWATIIKFDQELYKKEKELQAIREQEQKRKMKRELDRQVQEKQRMVQGEREELDQYNDMQRRQLNLMDQREQERQDHR